MSLSIKLPQLTNKTAYLKAISHASDLDQLVEPESYKTPSMLPSDEHPDLVATSSKLTFGEVNINVFIPVSPISSNNSPELNHNILKESPEESPKESSNVSPKESPKESSNASPKESPNALSK